MGICLARLSETFCFYHAMTLPRSCLISHPEKDIDEFSLSFLLIETIFYSRKPVSGSSGVAFPNIWRSYFDSPFRETPHSSVSRCLLSRDLLRQGAFYTRTLLCILYMYSRILEAVLSLSMKSVSTCISHPFAESIWNSDEGTELHLTIHVGSSVC